VDETRDKGDGSSIYHDEIKEFVNEHEVEDNEKDSC
jgi:hypothetical protein